MPWKLGIRTVRGWLHRLPRAMRSRLHHRQRPALMGSEPCHRSSIIEKTAFLQHFASAIQRTKPVPPLSQIQSYRDLTVLMLLLHRRRAYPGAQRSGALRLLIQSG
jgi:hypothetical protein